MASFILNQSSDGIVIAIKVVPGASRNRIAGVLGDALKVSVSKPPSGGEANRAVIEVLAAALGVGRKDIEIVAGQSNPRKQVRIRNASLEQVAALQSA